MQTKTSTESRVRGRAIETTVESFTRPDTHYTVRLYEGGSTCNCPAYRKGHRNPCKHILKVSGFNAKLADGRRCKVLDSIEHTYSRRIWGFDCGHYQHSLCELTDGSRVVESTHSTGRTQIRRVVLRGDWRAHIPHHAHGVRGGAA